MTFSPHGPLRVGIGGPVGSGKTALVDRLCKNMRDTYDIAVVTNDIYTEEDTQFLIRSGALLPSASWESRPALSAYCDPRGCFDKSRRRRRDVQPLSEPRYRVY